MKYYLLSGLIMILLVIGGSLIESAHPSTVMVNENQIEISPAEVFEGDAIKLKPHLGLTTGAVGIQYHGSKNFISTSYEIWERGKLKQHFPGMSSMIQTPFNGEVSISLQDPSFESKNQRYKVTVVVSSENGYGSSTFMIDKFDPELTGGYGPIHWDTTQLVDDDQEVAVWGMFAMDGFSTSETMKEQAKKADWAFLLKLKMEEESDVRNK